MNNAIAHRGFVDVPYLWVTYVKSDVGVASVCLRRQLLMQPEEVILKMAFKKHDIVLVPLTLLEDIPRFEKILQRTYLRE